MTDTLDATAIVDAAITSRRSVRGFLPTPVSREQVEHLLEVASRAPSGTNMQPWQVHVVSGAAQRKLTEALVAAHYRHGDEHDAEFEYYPAHFPEPYKSRRRKVGWDLYGLVGIKKGDSEKMAVQVARNYQFFDAPVGLIFTMDRVLEVGSWLDYGMFIENIMIAARGAGLHSCPQVAFARYHKVLREHLGIPDDQIVICGMSIGFIDETAPANALKTERVPVSAFSTFHWDET